MRTSTAFGRRPRMSTSIQLSPTPTLAPASLQLGDHRVEMSGRGVLDAHVAAGDRAGDEIGAALDAVGQHFVARAAAAARRPAMTILSVPAPWIFAPMAIRKFARSTTSGSRAAFSMNGLALGQRRRHHEVLRAGDRDGIEHQTRAPQPAGARADVAAVDRDVGAHGLQPRDVDVDGPRADRAAAGQRHVGLAEARQQRPQHQDRGAHGLHQLVRREAFARR